MTNDEVRAWDDFIRGKAPHPPPPSLGPLSGFEEQRPSSGESEGPITQWLRKNPMKPRLTAADLVMLREMKVGL